MTIGDFFLEMQVKNSYAFYVARNDKGHINRSLFDLASCIHALCDGNRDHVPFRQGAARGHVAVGES